MRIDRPIAIALTLFVVLLLVFFFVAPEYKTFKGLQIELGEKKAEYNAEFDYYAAIKKTYDDLQARQDDIKKIDDALPSDPDLGRIIYYLQQIVAENGLVTKSLFLSKSSVSSPATKTSNNVKDMTFSADLLGSYPALENFMMSLEKSTRIFDVASISFGAGGSSSSQQGGQSQSQAPSSAPDMYDFNLQIVTHSY